LSNRTTFVKTRRPYLVRGLPRLRNRPPREAIKERGTLDVIINLIPIMSRRSPATVPPPSNHGHYEAKT
jgi:hypothetical protein